MTCTPEEVKMKMAALQESIHLAHPSMTAMLRDIHTLLRSDPENVTLMDDSDIAILVAGLKIQTKTDITATVLKTKIKKNVTVDDI